MLKGIMATREQLGAFKDEVIRQYQEADWIGKLAVTGATLTLSVEWLFNEAIVGTAGGQALVHTHNALQTMATTGAASTIEQLIFGTSAAFAIAQAPRLMDRARETFYKPAEVKPDGITEPAAQLTFAARALYKVGRAADATGEAFSLGVALPLFLHNARETQDFGSNMGNVGRNAVVIGIGNFMLAGAAVGILSLGEAAGAQGVANFAVAVISNPLVWAGGFGLYRGRNVITQTANSWVGKLQRPPVAP